MPHECVNCGRDREVLLPERLVEQCHRGKLLIFAGSGASTEAHNVLSWTFYDEIRHALGAEEDVPFPDLMSLFVAKHSRSELLTRFHARTSYIEDYPDLLKNAVRFHVAVAQNPYLQEIVTTNWDSYFERMAGAVPLVVGADFDYWDLPDRKVLKVHGSVLNPGTVVATREEYERSLESLQRGALGGALRHLLSTRSVVFVGYSMRDEDIATIVSALREDLATAADRCYFVHPSQDFVPPLPGAETIVTTAGSFAEQLDQALVERDYLLPLEMYGRLENIDGRLRAARDRVERLIDFRRYPLALYTSAYQDGIRHALDRARARRPTGEDRRHHALHHRASGYDGLYKAANRKRNYWDASYIEGYLTGLIVLSTSELALHEVPLYFCPGYGQSCSLRRIGTAIRGGSATHKAAFSWAARRTREVAPDMFINHPPVLL
jgi:hypothetical protein